MKTTFQAPAAIQSFRTLVDGGNKLDVVTQELPPEEAVKLLALKGKVGWFVFAEQELTEQDIPDVKLDSEIGETKTPSQRLRNAIYVYWSENTDKKTDFNDYYKKQLEKFINVVKEQI